MVYMFVSFVDVHTCENIGCCIVQAEKPEDAMIECTRLELIPDACYQARGYLLDEETFHQQGMKLNVFYPASKMEEMGFERG